MSLFSDYVDNIIVLHDCMDCKHFQFNPSSLKPGAVCVKGWCVIEGKQSNIFKVHMCNNWKPRRCGDCESFDPNISPTGYEGWCRGKVTDRAVKEDGECFFEPSGWKLRRVVTPSPVGRRT